MRKIDELKLKRIEMSKAIREKTAALKQMQKGGKCCSIPMFELYRIKTEFRSYHIAYCELRGRTRDQIEKPKQDNPANERLIAIIKSDYAWEIQVTK